MLKFSCITNRTCLASIQGSEKYIYHFGKQPEEFFDLSKDPFEKQNLISERSKEEIDERREDLIAWSTGVNAPALLLQHSAYSCRVWITLIKLPYAPLRYPRIGHDIHQDERLCGRLLPSVLRVSEKTSSRKSGEQGA